MFKKLLLCLLVSVVGASFLIASDPPIPQKGDVFQIKVYDNEGHLTTTVTVECTDSSVSPGGTHASWAGTWTSDTGDSGEIAGGWLENANNAELGTFSVDDGGKAQAGTWTKTGENSGTWSNASTGQSGTYESGPVTNNG